MMINYLVVCQLGGGGTKQRDGTRKLCFRCWIFWVSINDQDQNQYLPFVVITLLETFIKYFKMLISLRSDKWISPSNHFNMRWCNFY